MIPFQWWTAEDDRLDLHIMGGVFVLALLLFRLFWGLVGSSTARFAGFIKGPTTVFAYLRGRGAAFIGHSPVGALSVVALIGLLSIEVGLGLFAGDEDGLESGPLAHLIGIDLSEDLADLHEDAFDILLVLIAVHLLAILYYALIKRKNLVVPMISGHGEAPEGAGEMERAPVWRFVLAAAAAAALALWVRAGLPL